MKRILIAVIVLWGCWNTTLADSQLESGWLNPPRDSRLRAYWWWLNGNVTKEAITRDLEQMKAKGFGGALICDAGGAEQDGNDPVPHGPTFFTPEWRELYKHCLCEADRLGLEMSLNIQSGWNLGGPMVKPDDAPKKLVWSETWVTGPFTLDLKLVEPKHPKEFYRDLFVLGWRVRENTITASSEQMSHPAYDASDGRLDSFWVSASTEPEQGPTRQKPEWLQYSFPVPTPVAGLRLSPRSGYGPRAGELRVSDDGISWRMIQEFSAQNSAELRVDFPETRARYFRVLFFSAFDPQSANSPRNVQVAEFMLLDPNGDQVGRWMKRRAPLLNLAEKALLKPLSFSAPDTTPLLQELPPEPSEDDTRVNLVRDLSGQASADGTLRWEVPPGQWEIVRFGYTLNDHCHVSTCSEGWQGYALDPFDAGAFRRYWDAVVEPLIADAGPLAGKTLKYLHTDSWEVEVGNWTPTLCKEFRQRRGYDLLPFLPVIAGRIVNSRGESNRFLNDFRKTMGELAIDNHYQLFRDGAHRHGMLIHPESGGPHAVPVDAQRCLGFNDAPMSEFWAWSWRHRVGDQNRFFVKQPASAAHTYGRKLVLAEGFTTIGPHWQETLWDNLKPSFDKALCEGLNLLVWHAFVCSPSQAGIPGQQYFAGTHLNPNVTWWSKSGAFFDYINRSQFMLQQGLFVADVAYYYGDHVPNFAQLKSSDPSRVLPGYDYDVITEESLLTSAKVRDGRLTLPDGMSYRLLVLRSNWSISLPVLRKLKELVRAGATIIGPRPVEAQTLQEHPRCDDEVKRLAHELWGELGVPASAGSPSLPPKGGTPNSEQAFGKGRVIAGKTAREVLLADGVKPDFEFLSTLNPQLSTRFDYIHRRAGDAEIYFVANRSNRWEEVSCTFRVAGKAPELWDAVTGERRFAATYASGDGRTTVPLELPPCGSIFVVFRSPASAHPASGLRNTPRFTPVQELNGPWTVKFDPKWGGPSSAEFEKLASWTTRPEPGIKYYSGSATYAKTFDLPAALQQGRQRIWLDLGEVQQLAEVRLNGKSFGVVWAPPFRVDATEAVRLAGNKLEIEVVNFWPNRIIGDDALPAEKRLTRTNIRKLTKDTPLMASGLLGPVILGTEETAMR